MNVSDAARRALRQAMERLFAGQPQRTDGKLTKQNLWKEAGISRATMNRATDIIEEWNARINQHGETRRPSPHDITQLSGELRRSRADCRELRLQVDAAATVIATLLAENAALREQTHRQSAVVVPLDRTLTRRG